MQEAKVKLNICDEKALRDASGLLHDATTTARETGYDPTLRTFRAVFNRRMWETSRRQGMFRRMKMSVIHSCLTFNGVEDSHWVWSDRGQQQVYELSHIEHRDSQIALHFHTGERVIVKTKRLEGVLEDLDEPWDDPNPPGSLSFGRDT